MRAVTEECIRQSRVHTAAAGAAAGLHRHVVREQAAERGGD